MRRHYPVHVHAVEAFASSQPAKQAPVSTSIIGTSPEFAGHARPHNGKGGCTYAHPPWKCQYSANQMWNQWPVWARIIRETLETVVFQCCLLVSTITDARRFSGYLRLFPAGISTPISTPGVCRIQERHERNETYAQIHIDTHRFDQHNGSIDPHWGRSQDTRRETGEEDHSENTRTQTTWYHPPPKATGRI